MKPSKSAYDCVVIGGGPAGSTTAALVAQAGHRVLLLERESFPRRHVGESLMPETYWSFERLGVLDLMKNSDYVKKYSVQFVSNSGKASEPFYFNRHDPRECSQTWQVERDRFDLMLVDNARRLGAECHFQSRVSDVLFNGKTACGVRVQLEDASTMDIACKVVVDATGQHGLLANRLAIKKDNPSLRKAAIWGHFRGLQRDPGVDEGATIILHTKDKNSWFWYIPLANDITSLGVVGDVDYLLKNRHQPEIVFEEELAHCPLLLARMGQATPANKLQVVREYSYTTTQHAGPGWVLAGDAWGFIDPIYSSGVFFAFKSGELAADAIIAGLKSGDLSGEQLGNWNAEFLRGVHWVRKLVEAYYVKEFSFGKFMMQYPNHKGNLVDILIGRIFYEGVGRIFDDMDPMLKMSQPTGGKEAPPKEMAAVAKC